jgi:hypothetical protein
MTFRVETTITGMTGAPYLSVMHFRSSDVADTPDAAVAAVGDFWGDLPSILANDMSFTVSGEVPEFDPATGTASAFWSVTPVTGTFSEAGEKIPFAAQGLLRWGTGGVVNGRQVKGRTFIPGITMGGIDEGGLLASTAATIAAAGNTLLGAADAQLVIWSRPVTGSEDPEDDREGSEHLAATASVWSQFAVLRGRRD